MTRSRHVIVHRIYYQIHIQSLQCYKFPVNLVHRYRETSLIKTKETETKFYRIPRNILIDYLKTEGITYEIPPENCHTLRYKIWHFLEVPKVKYFLWDRWRHSTIDNLNSVIARCQNVALFQYYFNIGFCFYILCRNIASFATKDGSHLEACLPIGRFTVTYGP